AQALGLPFLSPYLQSVGADFRHGANYATLASTALLPNTSLFVTGVSPFSLAIQLNQMKALKAKVDEYHSTPQKDYLPLPPPDAIKKSIYTLYIGQNDLVLNFGAVDTTARQVASTIDWTLKELYALGGRTFWVLNVLPLGCSPSILLWLPENSTDLDSFGCSVTYNKKTEEFNKIMKEAITQTRQSLPKAHIIHVDIYSALLELFRHPTEHGLKYGPKACCGYGGGKLNMDPRVGCGEKVDVNGTIVEAKACSDPENYVSWDGIHATEAANKLVTSAILDGSYFDPPFPIHQLCDPQPIGSAITPWERSDKKIRYKDIRAILLRFSPSSYLLLDASIQS
ncbi:GDSL lipase/esterase, partial [Dillenia turbinata]